MLSPASPDANSSDDTGRLLRFDERFVSLVWQFDRDGMPTFTRQNPGGRSLLLLRTFESPISYIDLPLAVTALDPYVTPISTLICSAGSIGYEASAYEQEA
jgi:hypothetical protein